MQRKGYVPESTLQKIIFGYLRLLSRWRRNYRLPLEKKFVNKIVIFKAGQIGDAVFTIPFIRAMRTAYPQAVIDLICYEKNRSLFEADMAIHAIHSYPFIEVKALGELQLFGMLKDVMRLRKDIAGADLFISLNRLESTAGTLKYALVSMLARPRWSIGISTRRRGFFLREEVPDDGYLCEHEIDVYNRVLRQLNADQSLLETEIAITGEDERSVEQEIGSRINDNRIVIGLHPGGGSDPTVAKWINKRWPVKNYVSLVRKLNCEYHPLFVLVGGRDEGALSNELLREVGGVIDVLDFTGRITLRQLAAVAKRCDIFVGNDTGPLHVVAAMNVPTVTVFGYSDHIGYAPRGSKGKNFIIRNDYDCSPCVYWFDKRGCTDLPCIRSVTVEQVYDGIQHYLRRA